MTSEEYEAWRSKMANEEYEEDQRALLLEARTAIRRAEFLHQLLSYLLHDWPPTIHLLAQGEIQDLWGPKEHRLNLRW